MSSRKKSENKWKAVNWVLCCESDVWTWVDGYEVVKFVVVPRKMHWPPKESHLRRSGKVLDLHF